MRKYIYTLGLLFGSLVLSVTGLSGQSNGEPVEATIEDLVIKPMRLPVLAEVGGSPFLTLEYQQGMVQTTDNKIAKNILVRFNIFNNAIMVQKDGQDMRLENFQTVTYPVFESNGVTQQVVFKQGYPEIDNHTDKSVYQVLSFGPNVHLLKFMSQKVEDAATLGDYSRREIVTTNQLYIYKPGGEIKRIKPGKQALVEALPALSGKIEEIVNEKKLNLKSESAIAELVNALNKP